MRPRYSLRIYIALLAVAMSVHTGAALAQTNTVPVHGKVTDTDGNPLQGAVISVRERMTGTTSGAEGEFTISAAAGETLDFSYVGYAPRSQTITAIDIPVVVALEDESIQMDKVVVVGYGTTSREKLTGSVATVSTQDFKNRPITDVSLALQGKVPGVQVTQTSGQPGADAGTITIRGVGTLNDSSPLVVIDGFESSFDKIDPKDIESMTVLKDAASAAIYGNKAANGVILIVTKKGRNGQTGIEYNGYVAVQTVTRYPELLGSVDFMELMNEARANSGQLPAYTDEYINHFRNNDDPVLYPDHNWADFYFKPAVQHNHYVKMNGGSEKLAYTLSMGYLGQDGIIEGTSLDKFTFRSNINNSFIKNRLRISTNISGYTSTRKDLVNSIHSTLQRIVEMQPMVNPKIEGYGWTGWFYDDAVREAGGGQSIKTSSFSGNINLQFDILRNLRLEAAASYDSSGEFNRGYAPNITLYNVETGLDGQQTIGRNKSVESVISESTRRNGSLSSFATLTWWANAGEHHHFKLLAGGQQYQWDAVYYQTERKRLTANLPSLTVGDPSTQKNTGWETHTTSLSAFGRFNYDYKDKYLLEANIRYDGSSKFARGNKWGLFPSFSLGWRISQEGFMKGTEGWLSELKVRGSWGRLGNEKIWSAYAGTDILAVGSTNYIWENQNTTGSALAYMANRDLTWETTTQTNVGLDITLFNSLNITADYYIKKTDGILMQLPVSSTLGFMETPWQNAGSMRNNGLEFQVTYWKALTKDVQLTLGGSISFNRNRILDLKGASPILNPATAIMLKEGMAINTLYGYDIEGIYQSEEEIHNHLVSFDRLGNPVNSYSGLVAAPGDIRFKDQNGDGIIDLDNDRVALGDPNPDFLFSFNVGLKFYGFDFTAFFQGVYGGQGWSAGALVSPFFNNCNSAAWMRNRWTPENPNNTYQRVYLDNQRANIRSAYYMEDMSYLRLKNLELGYNFPDKMLRKIRMKGLRIFVSGQNLMTLTRYTGFDPERAGLDYTNIYDYPLVKTFTLGLNFTF